jgi:CDP-diacylglycerol--glycerol-3-phosphate 3-phosphatidyltransferase
VECRPGTAAAATVVIAATIVLALRGVAHTVPGADAGSGDAFIGPRVRAWYRGLFEPLETWLAGLGIRPDHLTGAQLAVSLLAGAAFAAGAAFLAGWLTILAGTLDILDGGLARRTGLATARGAFLDSVADRCAEFATFVGLGILFRDGWMLLVVAIAAFASLMVSYVRARAEGLGIALRSGRVQRPERYVILGFGGWISGLASHLLCPVLQRPTHAVLAVAVCLLAAVATWTALQRARDTASLLRGGGAT